MSTNPHVQQSHLAPIFRLLQILLRSSVQDQDVQIWLKDKTNSKSVLATSAAAMKRAASRAKQGAGIAVYPFTSEVREMVATSLPTLVGMQEGLSSVSLAFFV
jgi:hypothetical protein